MSSTAQRIRGRAGAWLGRALRVSLGLVAVGGATGLIAVRVSYAQAADAGLNFGEELRQLGEGHLTGSMASEVYELSLNGQPFDTVTTSTRRPMKEVLDYFQDECKNDSSGLGDGLAHLSETLQNLPRSTGVPGHVVVRKTATDRSFVFCMAPDHELSLKERFARLQKVSQTGDFGHLGDVRYVSVMKDGDGSTVTSVWTHGSLNVNTMFPKVGDSPGEDLGAVPRPDGARRILTGHIVGAPYGVNVFEVPGVPGATLGGLDAKLVKAGWKPVELPDEIHSTSRFYSLGSAMDIAVVARQGSGGNTDVSYMVSSAVGTVSR
jgi:hypothetical protein